MHLHHFLVSLIKLIGSNSRKNSPTSLIQKQRSHMLSSLVVSICHKQRHYRFKRGAHLQLQNDGTTAEMNSALFARNASPCHKLHPHFIDHTNFPILIMDSLGKRAKYPSSSSSQKILRVIACVYTARSYL